MNSSQRLIDLNKIYMSEIVFQRIKPKLSFCTLVAKYYWCGRTFLIKKILLNKNKVGKHVHGQHWAQYRVLSSGDRSYSDTASKHLEPRTCVLVCYNCYEGKHAHWPHCAQYRVVASSRRSFKISLQNTSKHFKTLDKTHVFCEVFVGV